jgi:uncharacterized glyoxalase superfamily protein PhnB
MRFNGVCLITDNVVGLTEFYSTLLGVEAAGDAVHAEIITQGAGLTIFSVVGMEQMAPHSMEGTDNGRVILAFEVEDADNEYERVKAMGVEFVMLPTTHPWGNRSFWFKDPDGNIIDFYAESTEAV